MRVLQTPGSQERWQILEIPCSGERGAVKRIREAKIPREKEQGEEGGREGEERKKKERGEREKMG